MTLPAFLLRCLLALALVAGGVPTYGMARAAEPVEAAPKTGCHEPSAPEPVAADHAQVHADCCGSATCQCDCLQHMPVVVFSLPAITAPAFVAAAPVSRLLQQYSLLRSTSLRPPIG